MNIGRDFSSSRMTAHELCESTIRRSSGDKRRAIGWRRISKAALTLHFKRAEARAEFSRLGDSRCPNLVLQADRWLVANGMMMPWGERGKVEDFLISISRPLHLPSCAGLMFSQTREGFKRVHLPNSLRSERALELHIASRCSLRPYTGHLCSGRTLAT